MVWFGFIKFGLIWSGLSWIGFCSGEEGEKGFVWIIQGFVNGNGKRKGGGDLPERGGCRGDVE